ncbi:hypothetical protein KR044_009335, partial [Drosophila immigrans]
TTMLDGLNDDCQLTIIKYLNLNDQIALYLATGGISNRVISNVIHAWEQQLCFKLNSDNYTQFKETPELLDIFLSSINATVQKLKLEWVTMDFLKRWEDYTFPNMKTLEYTLDRCHSKTNVADDALEIMAKLFPELRSLKTYNSFYYGLLAKWTQLRKLELTEWCENVYNHERPEMIISCQLLEELTLSCDFHWPHIYDAILGLPKLHTLSYCLGFIRDDILTELHNRGRDIHKMVFNDCIWLYCNSKLHKLRNLRHLILLEEKNVTSQLISELVAGLKQLVQIDLIDFQIWTSETELWKTIARCPSLKILNISGMQMYEDFFVIDRSIMENTLNNRSQPLTLHCHNTGENETLVSE